MKTSVFIKDTNQAGIIQYQDIYVFNTDTLTTRELIVDRVCQEIEVYNQLKSGYLKGLVQIYVPKKNQKSIKLPKRLDYEQFYSVALEAFQNHDLSILVNDYPIVGLTTPISLVEATEIAFLKYIPLMVGTR